MKPRKSMSVYVLLVGILGLLIVAGIFTFQIVDEATKSQIPAEQKELVKPIEGVLEQRAVDNLNKRKVFSREEILIAPIISISPTTTPVIPVATASSQAATTQETQTR